MGKIRSAIQTAFLKGIENTEYSVSDGVLYWRERIFNGLLMALLVFGSIAIVPNIIASLYNHTHIITATDTLAVITIYFLFFNKKIRLKYKISITILSIYVLSIVLLVILGPLGPGLVWLSSTSILAAFLVGRNAAIRSILFNLSIILFLIVLIKFQVIHTIFFESYTPLTWFAISLNVIIFNALSSLPVAFLVEGLEKIITNEKRLKTELELSNAQLKVEMEHAKESDQLKSTFLANLSHEIRTPMNAIVGFSELIQMEEDKTDTLNKYCEYIIQNSVYLRNLINDIVDISLIESGQIRLKYEYYTIKNVFDELDPIVEANPIRKRRSEVKLIFKGDEKLLNKSVYIDSTHLKQILLNLIINALKYTPEGTIEINVKEENPILEFWVTDSGVGIPQEEQSKIFNRFTKIERKSNHLMPGIGIGLSITKGLIEAMKGNIWFNSVENIGSSFHFIIPQEFPEPSSPMNTKHDKNHIEMNDPVLSALNNSKPKMTTKNLL